MAPGVNGVFLQALRWLCSCVDEMVLSSLQRAHPPTPHIKFTTGPPQNPHMFVIVDRMRREVCVMFLGTDHKEQGTASE